MQEQLRRNELSDEDRFHFPFLARQVARRRARLREVVRATTSRAIVSRREMVQYEADETSEKTRRSKQLFTPEFFAARAGQGSSAPDPIFIVGLPRAARRCWRRFSPAIRWSKARMELPEHHRYGTLVWVAAEREPRHRSYPEALAEISRRFSYAKLGDAVHREHAHPT